MKALPTYPMMRGAAPLGLVLLVLAALGSGCARAPQVPIFLWHAVGEGSGDRYDLSVAELDGELARLERAGVTSVTLDALFDAWEGKGTLPPRAAVLTFDDGRACLYTAALPLLKKHHMRAELFVVTSFLAEDAAHRQWHVDDTGAHPYLTWPELEEMVASGAFVVEAHSVTHPRLPDLPRSAQQAEVTESGRVLRARLSAPVHFFAYPFGASSLLTRLLVERAGYRGGISVGARPFTFRFAVPRISIRRGAEASFEHALAVRHW